MSTTLEIQTVNPSEYGIEDNKASELIGNLPQIKAERAILEEQYSEVIKLDIEDPETSKKAKTLRLLFIDNRTKGINVWHSTTKEFFLKGGQFVDAIKRKEVAVNERIEENLEKIEKHFENLEIERKAKLNNERIAILEPFNSFVPMGLNFGEISEDEFSKILNGAKLQFEQLKKEEAEAEKAKLEQERLANIHKERREKILPYWEYTEDKSAVYDLSVLTDEAFDDLMQKSITKKSDYEAQQEEIRKENERLKQLEVDRLLKLEQNAEKHIKTLLKAGFEISNNDAYMDKMQHRYGKGNYSVSVGNLQNMNDDEILLAISNVENWIEENDRLEKEKADAEKKLAKERADQVAKLKAEQDAKAKLEAELQAKKDEEAKAEKAKIEFEKRLKEEAEALAKAPIKDQLNTWVKSFELPVISLENDKAELIKAKFEAFKRWSLAEIELM